MCVFFPFILGDKFVCVYQPASHRRRSHIFLIHFLSTMNALFLARRIHPFLSLVEIFVRLRRMTPQNRAYITHTKWSSFPSVSTLQGTAGYVNIPDRNGIRFFFPPDWGMLRRSRCIQIFLYTHGTSKLTKISRLTRPITSGRYVYVLYKFIS